MVIISSFGNAYSALIKLAMGFRTSICSKIILRADVRGTASIMPTIPHVHPQNINEIRMTIGDKLRFFPVIFGSIIFPMMN